MLILPIIILYSSDCSSHSINVFFEPIQREFADYFRPIIFRNTGSIDGNGEKFSIKDARSLQTRDLYLYFDTKLGKFYQSNMGLRIQETSPI